MRVVIQRVQDSSVLNVETKKKLGQIKKGLLLLVGIGKNDNPEDAENVARKIFNLRIFSDKQGKMNLSVKDVQGQVLAISQFTLYADLEKGNRPSFFEAKEPVEANKIYEHFVDSLRKQGVVVETGEFGAHMQISSKLDGPVTIVI